MEMGSLTMCLVIRICCLLTFQFSVCFFTFRNAAVSFWLPWVLSRVSKTTARSKRARKSWRPISGGSPQYLMKKL